jgi:hypothetical protein
MQSARVAAATGKELKEGEQEGVRGGADEHDRGQAGSNWERIESFPLEGHSASTRLGSNWERIERGFGSRGLGGPPFSQQLGKN